MGNASTTLDTAKPQSQKFRGNIRTIGSLEGRTLPLSISRPTKEGGRYQPKRATGGHREKSLSGRGFFHAW